MIAVVDALLVVGFIAGGWLCWFSYSLLRTPAQLGRRALAVAVGILGIGSVCSALVGIVPWLPGPKTAVQVWALLPLVTWNLMTVPWFVFALQYTGTRQTVSRGWIIALTIPVLTVPLRATLQVSSITLPPTITAFAATAVFAYVLSLVAAGCLLLVRQTSRDARGSIKQALSLSVVPLGSLLLWNLSTVETTPVVTVIAFDLGTILVAAGLAAARYRYGLFALIPAVGTLGENALIEQTDDLMLVVDADEQIIRSNQIAVDTLDATREELLAGNLETVIGTGVDDLTANETVAIETATGTRQYDPQLSAVTDPYGNELGQTLSLRDVSSREVREQRLAVLNRVLRHNIRNQLDVIKSHAEALPADEQHRAAIISAADDIAAFGRQATEIDQVISSQAASSQVDLRSVVERTLDSLGTSDVTITTDMPETTPLTTNQQAIRKAIESPLENAIKYATSSVTVTVTDTDGGYRVRISDDGPGIPSEELNSLETGTEDPLKHTTGLGLWQLKWAVMILNGHVSFDTDDGTTVQIDIPNCEPSEPALSGEEML